MPCFWQPLPVVLSTWVQSHEIHSLGQGYRLDSGQFISRSQLNLTGTMHPRWKLEFWTDVRMIMASPLVWKDAFQQSCSAVTLLTWALLRTTLWVSSKTFSTVYRSMKMSWFVKIDENSTIVSRSELRNGGSWKGREKTTIESQCPLRINIEITWEELIFIHTEKYILHIMYVLYVR